MDVIQPNSSVSFDAALQGSIEVPGCGDRAYSYTYGWREMASLSDDLTAITSDVGEVIGGYATTPESLAHVASWSQCMHERGYDYATPVDASLPFSDQPSISDEERTTRMADLACDTQVGLTQARSTEESAAVDQWVADHAVQIQDIEQRIANVQTEIANRVAALDADGVEALGG
jgi:hypothetical protein